MTGINVAPDKTYLIAEERIRFPVPADVQPQMVPIYSFKTLEKSIDIFEKHRGWKMLDRVPARKQFPNGVACCDQMSRGKTGESLTIKFMPSDFQGDTDDAHNFDELSNPQHRLLVENTIDWVAIVHFWEPAIVINNDAEREFSQSLSLEDGFARWSDVPEDAWTAVKERLNKKYGA